MMLIGNLIYVTVLLINALAILSEDRFLARINFSSATYDPAFGAGPDNQSIRVKAINLLASVRTLMRSTLRSLSLCLAHLLLPASPFLFLNWSRENRPRSGFPSQHRIYSINGGEIRAVCNLKIEKCAY
ncbi:Yos1-like-domain-containing protein [Xylaria bambusicola]|uniref:Yos1-like-domain-containing protein n=1 Tax=Xylaria bambusicola TaxID=326684 RepID=UPI0020072E3D|nr:Yos1-like-domain-containing protein [Xylaria bambusicola]KAI0505102.1 Yos1-like-domain-containing protein [Xylaria bambusicola]